jgi:hypothetical protein
MITVYYEKYTEEINKLCKIQGVLNVKSNNRFKGFKLTFFLSNEKTISVIYHFIVTLFYSFSLFLYRNFFRRQPKRIN